MTVNLTILNHNREHLTHKHQSKQLREKQLKDN